jgi:hypothetical protein
MKYYLFHTQGRNGEIIRYGAQAKSQSDAAKLLPGHIRQELPYLLLKVTDHPTLQSTQCYSNVRIA